MRCGLETIIATFGQREASHELDLSRMVVQENVDIVVSLVEEDEGSKVLAGFS